MDSRIVVLAATLGLILVTPVTAPAQCAGDCHGDGEVTIDELLIMVNVALDSAPLAACEPGDTSGDGVITVNEIIAAVNKALGGCVPDVTGTWLQDQAAITASTCAPDIRAIIQEGIDGGQVNCTLQLEQSGEQVTITSTCAGETDVFGGTVNASGLLTVNSSEQDMVDDCSFAIAQNTSGMVTTSPTVGTHVMAFHFLPACGLADCSITVQVRWSKLVS